MHSNLAVIFLAAAAIAPSPAYGQSSSSGSSMGFNSSIGRLFGDIHAFSARAEVQVFDDAQKELVSTPVDFAFLDNKMRVEVDLTRMKNKDMPPAAVSIFKQMGLADVVSVTRPDKERVYIIYPQSRCFMPMELPKDETQPKLNKVKKTVLGQEKIDGHSCVKNQVVVTSPSGQSIQAMTWEATDLKGFPLKIHTREKDKTSVIHFSTPDFTKPEPSQFEPPPGFAQYKDQQEMLAALSAKAPPTPKKP